MKNNENMTITVAFDWHNNEAKLRKELAGFIKDGTYPADLKVGKVKPQLTKISPNPTNHTNPTKT